jgi:hypothetical protein
MGVSKEVSMENQQSPQGNLVQLTQSPENAQLSEATIKPEDVATHKIKKFAFGVVLIFAFFALLWLLWKSICSGSDDQDDDDEGSFCQIVDGAADVMNDITAGITFMVQNILILVALGVMYLVISIFCNISSKCPDSFKEITDWLDRNLFNTETETPAGLGDGNGDEGKQETDEERRKREDDQRDIEEIL